MITLLRRTSLPQYSNSLRVCLSLNGPSVASSYFYSGFTRIGGKAEDIVFVEDRDELVKAALSDCGISTCNHATFPTVGNNNLEAQEKIDPTTGKPLATMKDATWEQTSELLDLCHDAQVCRTRWKNIPGDKRVDIVLEMTEALEENVHALGLLETLEIGKIPSESRGELIEVFDVAKVIDKRRQEVGGPYPYFTRKYESSDPKRRELGWYGQERQLPCGILGKMTAFNFPYAVYGWGALPALAAGNGVILKPHPQACLTSLAMVKIMSHICTIHGFEGLVSISNLQDWEETDRLWRDERVNIWEVTGSVSMGKAFSYANAPSFRRAILELGGNNAVIIHKDCDVDQAVESSVFGSVGTAGQRCTSTRSIFIHEKIYENFMSRFLEAYQTRVNIGDPLQPGVNMGPVHHQNQVENYIQSIAKYKAKGSKLLIG
eukprot:UC4_evm1s1298